MLCAVIFAETLTIRFPVEIHRHISYGIEDIDKKKGNIDQYSAITFGFKDRHREYSHCSIKESLVGCVYFFFIVTITTVV